jgi:hypothetical protein
LAAGIINTASTTLTLISTRVKFQKLFKKLSEVFDGDKIRENDN